jgi:hypothetical protein
MDTWMRCDRRAAAQAASDLRAGTLVEHEGKLMVVLKQVHNPGIARQAGSVTIDLREVRTGAKSKVKVTPNTPLQVRPVWAAFPCGERFLLAMAPSRFARLLRLVTNV